MENKVNVTHDQNNGVTTRLALLADVNNVRVCPKSAKTFIGLMNRSELSKFHFKQRYRN